MVSRISATGPASASTAWSRYVTREAWPTWAPHIRRVRPEGEIHPGDRGVVLGPLVSFVPYTILERDDVARRWSWWVGVGPVGVRLDHGVDEGPEGTTAWADVHLPAPLVAIYRPLAGSALRRLVGG